MSLGAISLGAAAKRLGQVRHVRGSVSVAVGVLGLFLLLAIVGPWIAPHPPNAVDLAQAFAPADASHPFGSDASGRDLVSRILVGARTAIIGPVLLVLAATVVGVALALVGVWHGGLVDTLVSRLLDVALAFPGLLLAIVAAAVFGPSLTTAALALTVSYVPYVGRVVRAEAVRERQLPYVQAAWLQGMSASRICTTQILPNLMPLVIAQVVLSLSYAVIDLAAMSYLGLGVQAPTADWGSMVAAGQNSVGQGHPQELLAASGCIVALVLALGIVGDALSERSERR